MGYGFTSSVHHDHSLGDNHHLVGIRPLAEGNLEEVGHKEVAHWHRDRAEEGSRGDRGHRSDREGEGEDSPPWDGEEEIDNGRDHHSSRDEDYDLGSRNHHHHREDYIRGEGHADRSRPWEEDKVDVLGSGIDRAREEACPAECQQRIGLAVP